MWPQPSSMTNYAASWPPRYWPQPIRPGQHVSAVPVRSPQLPPDAQPASMHVQAGEDCGHERPGVGRVSDYVCEVPPTPFRSFPRYRLGTYPLLPSAIGAVAVLPCWYTDASSIFSDDERPREGQFHKLWLYRSDP